MTGRVRFRNRRRTGSARRMRRLASLLGVTLLLGAVAAGCIPPKLGVTTVVSGLDHPWDIGFLPNGTMLVTERPGRLDRIVNGAAQLVIAPADVVAAGEGGMLGLAVDPLFATNGYVFVCMASSAGGATDVRVVRFTLAQNGASVLARQDIVTGLPYTSGRHSGCRPRFGPDGALWVGTGDSATGTVPQDPNSLGGKVLRVNRDGTAAAGNPFGLRWYTRGHRNVQGLAFRPSDGMPFEIEHGTSRDDEVNVLQAGGNYGWDPVPGYNELRPMTDLVKFPQAIVAKWSSGSPTIAPSGATFVTGARVGQLERCTRGRRAEGAAAARVLRRGERGDRRFEHRAHDVRPVAIGRAGSRRQPLHQHRQRRRQRRRAARHVDPVAAAATPSCERWCCRQRPTSAVWQMSRSKSWWSRRRPTRSSNSDDGTSSMRPHTSHTTCRCVGARWKNAAPCGRRTCVMSPHSRNESSVRYTVERWISGCTCWIHPASKLRGDVLARLRQSLDHHAPRGRESPALIL